MTVALAGLSPPVALSLPEPSAPVGQTTPPTPDQLAEPIQRGQIEPLRALLARGANVNSVTSTRRSWPDSRPVGASNFIDPGTTLLNLAIGSGRWDIARLLIAAGADVNEPDANPRALRPLQTAAFVVSACCAQFRDGQVARQQLETLDVALISLLLAHGAHADARDGAGYSALHYAAESDNVAAIDRLLAAGVPVDSTTSRRSAAMPRDPLAGNPFYDLPAATPLILAVHGMALRAARDLLLHHANVNAQTRYGVTPLLLAAGGDDEKEMVILLLNNGADVNLAATRLPPPYNQPADQTPVLLAQSNVDLHPENLDIVDILLLRGAHLNPFTRAADAVRRAFYHCCYFPLSD